MDPEWPLSRAEDKSITTGIPEWCNLLANLPIYVLAQFWIVIKSVGTLQREEEIRTKEA